MKVINTDKAPAALGPYSQALESGNIVFVSGQIPLNPETGVIPETIEEQAEQAIRNAEAILKENGMTLSNVIKTTVLLDDLGNGVALACPRGSQEHLGLLAVLNAGSQILYGLGLVPHRLKRRHYLEGLLL